jgi:hypothetical protein
MQHELTGMTILRYANLALRFGLELCMLAALGYWGFRLEASWPIRLGLGIGTPLLAAIVWGTFLSPKATVPLSAGWRLLLELIVFGCAIVALYAAGQPRLAGIFAVVLLINEVLLRVWPD